MAVLYLKNESGSTIQIDDIGLYLPDATSREIDSNEINGYLTPDLTAEINAGNLVLSTTDVGNAAGDFTANDAIEALTITSRYDRDNPHRVTFTQAANQDLNTDITAAEAETLTDGSEASLLHNHDNRYYTIVQLETSGSSSIHWDNITDTPQFGSLHWRSPVKALAIEKGDTTAMNAFSAIEGHYWWNTDDDHLYRYDGSTWIDTGAPVEGDRFIWWDGSGHDDHIYEFDGSSWIDTTAPVDNYAVIVDDYFGKASQFIYDDTLTNPPNWIRMADVTWGDHSSLDGRSDANSHPGEAIVYNPLKEPSGLTATNVQDAIDELDGDIESVSGSLTTHIDDTTNPHTVTFTQSVAADVLTDITAAEAEILSDGSNADTLHIHSASIITFSNTASGLTATNVQDAIDELDGDIETVSGNLTTHINDTTNPHTVTFTQAVTADSLTDILASEAETLTDGSNADALHIHDAANIVYDNTISGLTATNVKAAIDELDGDIESVSGDLTTHINDTTNPHTVTFTQSVSADLLTDITAAEAETLTDGSNADTLHEHAASNITFDDSIANLGATNVQAAIEAIDTSLDNLLPRGTSFPVSPAPSGGDLFYRTDLNLTFQYDESRSEWLSITHMSFDWGSNVADGKYLNIHGATATQTGYLMPRNGTVLTLTAKAASGNQTKGLELHLNHDTASPIKTFNLSSGSYNNAAEDIDFSAGDYLQAFASSAGVPARDVVVMVTVAWRE